MGAAAPTDAQFPSRLSDEHWFGRLYSFLPPSFHVPPPEPEPAAKPAVYLHAVATRQAETQSGVQPAQFAETIPPPAVVPVPLGNRRIRAFPRTDLPVQIQWVPSPGGNEWTAVITSGVNLIIDGLPEFGSVDVSTDRLVLWTTGKQQPNLAGGHFQSEDTPLEIYMEGNVVFRQGERLVQAQSMYFDVNQQIGVVLNAEILTPLADNARQQSSRHRPRARQCAAAGGRRPLRGSGCELHHQPAGRSELRDSLANRAPTTIRKRPWSIP